MEFKFSCKWFEIAFSGDPGYVQEQIQKYEPFVLNVLKHMEKDLDAHPEIPGHGPGEMRKQQGKGHPGGRDGRRYDKRRRPDNRREARWKGPEDEPDDRRGLPGELFPEDLEAEPFDAADQEEVPDDKESAGPGSQPPEFPQRRRAPSIRKEELKKAVEDKKPRTHHDRVMVFGYYMEHEGRGSDFTAEEIEKCYRAVDQDPGANIDQVISHATRSGFILRFDKGRTTRFKLSSKGRRYVNDGLRLS